MTTVANDRITPQRHMETVDPPAWVWDLLRCEGVAPTERIRIVESESGDFAMVTGTVACAESLNALDLQHAVCALYVDIWREASRLRAHHPVRLWNFIPGIHARMGSSDGGFLDRYMVFNAGRFAAYTEWYGQPDMGLRAATATGIGHSGSGLVVHCLLGRADGIPIENPRQVPAYRYSRRRGPMPPVFSRATIIGDGQDKMILVGGTSSVCGERSVHLGDVRAQTLETLHNLACLVEHAERPEGRRMLELDRPSVPDLRRVLSAFCTLRVYCVRDTDAPAVQRLITEYFPRIESLEVCRADVCRRTLLVEIEGTAACGGDRS
jgi:chorismate lyase/3-hydroxybenzoate synthase